MRAFKRFAVIAMAICFASCGGKKGSNESEEIVVKPIETEVSGDMEGCFTVVDKEYKATGDWGDGIITVQIERTDEDLPFELNGRELWTFGTSGAADHVKVGFGIEFLDEDENVLEKVSANASGLSASYSPDEAIELVKLKPGKKGSIRFTAVKGAVSFRISSAYEEGEGWGSDSSSISSSDDDDDVIDDDDNDDDDDDDASSSSSSSEDWDALLDSYDDYVTKYITYMKKAANGDMSALSEYPSLMQKAQEFSERMSNAQGEMTAKQWARYMKITNKMSQAAAEM